MAIQVRRGKKKDFDPDKMLPGEWAGTTDTKEVFFTFAPGDTKKMATYEDMTENIREATGEITAGLTEGVSTAIEQANTAADTANQAAETAQASITNLTEDVTAAIENSNTATNTATQAAQEAQEAAQEAREAAEQAGDKGTATKLASKRTFQTDLSSSEATEFDGTENNVHGVTGILPIENGGTGSNTGNVGNNIVDFTSTDLADPTDWTDVSTLTSGMTLTNLFNRISAMFKNVRYLRNSIKAENLFVTKRYVGGGMVLDANGAMSKTITLEEIGVQSGYTLIGVIGIYVQQKYIYPYVFLVNETRESVRVDIRNTSSSSITFTLIVDLLFAKT